MNYNGYMTFHTYYQPHPANLGGHGPVVAHAVDKGDANRSVADEQLSFGTFTTEEWPGRGPACHSCEEVLRSLYQRFVTGR